jgi:hypothetical protein
MKWSARKETLREYFEGRGYYLMYVLHGRPALI